MCLSHGLSIYLFLLSQPKPPKITHKNANMVGTNFFAYCQLYNTCARFFLSQLLAGPGTSTQMLMTVLEIPGLLEPMHGTELMKPMDLSTDLHFVSCSLYLSTAHQNVTYSPFPEHV